MPAVVCGVGLWTVQANACLLKEASFKDTPLFAVGLCLVDANARGDEGNSGAHPSSCQGDVADTDVPGVIALVRLCGRCFDVDVLCVSSVVHSSSSCVLPVLSQYASQYSVVVSH
jgi:hypothetical protein